MNKYITIEQQIPIYNINKNCSITEIGIGTAALGSVYGPIHDTLDIIHTAYTKGVTYFDTAPFYGGGKSELVLGEALRTLPRTNVTIATKFGRFIDVCSVIEYIILYTYMCSIPYT